MRCKLSYLSKPGLIPYMYDTVPNRLHELALQDPEHEAFIFYDINKKRSSLTRKQLWDRSVNVAKHLMNLGLKKGSPVAFYMSNSLEMLILTMGVSLAGGISFYFNSALKDGSDIVESINFLKGEMLCMDADYGDDNWGLLQNIWPAGETTCSSVSTLRHILFKGKGNEESYANRMNVMELIETDCSSELELPEVFPEDIVAYFCTSGSTGKPKTIIYTHFSILNWTAACNDAFGIHSESVFFCERTFSWIVGYPRTYLIEGARRLFIDTRMAVGGKHIADICEIIHAENCDVILLPGYLAVDLVQNEELCGRLRGVRKVIMSGERVCETIVSDLMKFVCKQVVVFYGATEVGGVSYFVSENIGDYEDGIIGKYTTEQLYTRKRSTQPNSYIHGNVVHNRTVIYTET